jgi:hypothetical protein
VAACLDLVKAELLFLPNDQGAKGVQCSATLFLGRSRNGLKFAGAAANDPRQALPLLLTAWQPFNPDDPAPCLEIRPLSGMHDWAVRSSESSFA